MKCAKSNLSMLAALILAALLINSCTQAPIDVRSEIEEANKTFVNTSKSGDPEAMSMLYTKDAKILPANGAVIEGRGAIKAYWSESMGQATSELVLETVIAEAYGDMAIEEGRYAIKVGSQEVDAGKYIVVWKKEGGKWLLHQDIWNSDSPPPTARASVGETVWVISNRIKADKVTQFEEYNFSVLWPAADEISPVLKNTVRLLRPVEPNKDGTFTYFYLMDPATSPEGYDMAKLLTAKYGKEKSDEYLKMFQDCLVDGQELIETVQTKR